MNDVREALWRALSDDDDLTGLLSNPGAIYHQYAPERSGTPFIVFSKSSGTPQWSFAGDPIDHDVWLIKAIDRGGSASAAEDIAREVDRILNRADLDIDGRATLHVLRQSDVDYAEIDAGRVFHHVGGLYRISTAALAGS